MNFVWSEVHYHCGDGGYEHYDLEIAEFNDHYNLIPNINYNQNREVHYGRARCI